MIAVTRTNKPTASGRGNTATAFHDYAAKMEVWTDSTKPKDPFSPVKTQPNPKQKDSGTDEGMKAVLEAIKQLTSQTSEIASKVDSLGIQIQLNSVMLANMAKEVEFNAAEIKDCKTQLHVMEKDVAEMKKDNVELRERVLELERYKQRWNLWMRG